MPRARRRLRPRQAAATPLPPAPLRWRGWCPDRTAVPITAWPMPAMVVFTSAKSRLMMPGIVMMSLMPWTAWRSTSSAMRKLSKKARVLGHGEQFFVGDHDHRVHTVEQFAESPLGLHQAALASKAKGLVTDGDGRDAPFHFARDAITGARSPVPVPPPRRRLQTPCRQHFERFDNFFESSSAARRLTSGFDPAPSPEGKPHAQLQLDRRSFRQLERLHIGVGGHKLHAFHVRTGSCD